MTIANKSNSFLSRVKRGSKVGNTLHRLSGTAGFILSNFCFFREKATLTKGSLTNYYMVSDKASCASGTKPVYSPSRPALRPPRGPLCPPQAQAQPQAADAVHHAAAPGAREEVPRQAVPEHRGAG